MEIFNGIIQDYKAREIAMENGIASEQEAAATWFNEVSCNGEWEEAEKKPTYSKFINTIDCGDLYYDYGAGYYFVVRESSLNEAGWKSNAHPYWKETAHAASAPLSTKTDVITRDVAARYGFKPEYTNFHGYDVWEGNLNGKEEGELKSLLGINKFVSIDHNGKVRVLVYPSDRRNVLKINENTIRKIVAESVKKVLMEEFYPGNPGPDDFDYPDYYVTVDEIHSLKKPIFDLLQNFYDNMTHCVSEEIRKEADNYAKTTVELTRYLENLGDYDEWFNTRRN